VQPGTLRLAGIASGGGFGADSPAMQQPDGGKHWEPCRSL
jgi:hypothetical protein